MLLSRCSIGALLVGAVNVLGGCGDARPPALTETPVESSRRTPAGVITGANRDSPPPRTPAPAPAPSATDAWTGRAEMFRGDLGVVGFEAADAIVQGSTSASSSSIRIDADDASARWWAMTRIDVTGSLRHPALVSGARLTFNRDAPTPMPSGMAPLAVRAIGCSGPSRSAMAFDEPAQQVTLAISAGPSVGTRRLDFTASFGASGGQQITGSFVYEVP